jgi:transcriptional regulator with XRE-family HTH domain
MAAARGRGNGRTPEKVVELLSAEVARTSQAATARALGLTLRSVQNYIKGQSEPTQATLEKLATYFKTTVAQLRWSQDKAWLLFNQTTEPLFASLPPKEQVRYAKSFAKYHHMLPDIFDYPIEEIDELIDFLSILKKQLSLKS